MEVCGEAENRLASVLMQHELQIEKDVLDPLSQLAEVRNVPLDRHQTHFLCFPACLITFRLRFANEPQPVMALTHQ